METILSISAIILTLITSVMSWLKVYETRKAEKKFEAILKNHIKNDKRMQLIQYIDGFNVSEKKHLKIKLEIEKLDMLQKGNRELDGKIT